MGMDTTALRSAGVTGPGAVSDAVAGRSAIFEMTQAAEDAVLAPREAGRWPHDLRAALAARISALNGEDELAKLYAENAGDYAPLADPSAADDELAPVLSFMDKVAAKTRDVAAEDIAALQRAGVSDADIVRLCELNAFLAYQIRLIAGLRMMKGAEA